MNKITKQHHMVITAGTQHPDRLPASRGFEGPNKTTKQPHTKMQLSDRRPAL